ncbi:hypothetical protein NESM_000248500 [Novymonas esmeraldas]|uniref:Uncharacterized protein n=1 Tax=Novymonas esmeraldas TaxID=1808958 RepID=A0AAW0F697_9TRYP
MRHCLRCLCVRASGGVLSAAPPPVAPSADGGCTATLYRQSLDPAASPSDVARSTAALLPALGRGELALRQQAQLLHMLATRSIRNEDVMLQCFWAVFKAPTLADEYRAGLAASPGTATSTSALSAYTSSAFQVMTEQGFLNDPQMTAVALGRCVELAPYATLDGLRSMYRGLRAVNHMFFTVAEVAHHSSEVTEQMTTKEFYEVADDTPGEETLRHQPNLIDVLCGELEQQLRRLCATVAASHPPLQLESPRDLPPQRTASVPPAALLAPRTHEAQWFLDVLEALAVVGVMHASTLDSLTSLVGRYRAESSAGFFITALTHATRVEERVVDPVGYEESTAVRDARCRLTTRLSSDLQRVRGIHGYLRRHPQELLLLRRLFERGSADSSLSPALWDTVRAIRVAHRHTVATTSTSRPPAGALFQRAYDVKVKPISVNNAETERFVPPEYKTWRSPVATPRGGHPRNGRPPKRMAFGTRRISSNYIQKKRKKYCPAVF